MPCVGCDFLNWDDRSFVVSNENIRSLSLQSIAWMLTTSHQGVWHPLAWFSHAVDRSIWGLNPAYHHLVNVLIHVLNVLLVCVLFVKLLEGRAVSQTAAYVAAFAAALVFGVHPLRVESVAWLSERKDVLCSFFFLASLITYLNYARAESGAESRKYYGLTFLFCLMSLMSKPMAVTLPFVYLLLDYYPLERPKRATLPAMIREKLPFLAIVVAVVGVNMMAAEEWGVVTFSYVPAHMRIMNAFYALVFYIQKTVFPSGLLPLHQMDRSLDYFGPPYVLSALVVFSITAACLWRAARRDRIWAATWFYYLITMGPALGLFMSYRHAVAERYTYLPTLGFWMLACAGFARLWDHLGTAGFALAARIGSLCVVAAISAACITRTTGQIGVWKNSETLWSYVIKNAEYVPAVAHFGLGRAMEEKGRLDEALDHFKIAIRMHPTNNDYWGAMANVHARKGNLEESLKIYGEVLEKEPQNPRSHINVARILAAMGRADEAVAVLQKALERFPDHGGVLLFLSLVYEVKKDPERAAHYYGIYLSRGYPPVRGMESMTNSVPTEGIKGE